MTNEESFEQLVFTLGNRVTPTLYFISCDTERTETAIKQKLANALPGYKHFTLELSSQSILSLAETLRNSLPPEVLNSQALEYLLHLHGLETSLFATVDGKFVNTPLPQELNFERELLFNSFPFVTVIWSSKYFYREIFKNAPDLANWLINYFEFYGEGKEAPISEVPIKEALPYRGATRERKERIEQLKTLVGKLDREAQDQEKYLREKMDALVLLGEEYVETYQWSKAEKAYQEALALSDRLALENKKGQINYDLGDLYLTQRRFKPSLVHYKQCLKICEALEDFVNVAAAYHQIGYVFQEQRNWPEALANYLKAIRWNEKAGNEFTLGNTYHQIGMVYQAQRNWPEALANYIKSIEWYEKTGNEFMLGNTYRQIGMAYEEQRNWPEALASYREAITGYKKTGNDFALGDTYHQIGTMYQEQRNWPKALANYCEAIKWYEKTGNEFELGGTYYQIGRVYEAQHNWSDALANYNKAIEWYEKTGNKFGLGSTYHQIGRMYEERKKFGKAIGYFKKSVEMLKAVEYPDIDIAQNSLKRISEIMGNNKI